MLGYNCRVERLSSSCEAFSTLLLVVLGSKKIQVTETK